MKLKIENNFGKLTAKEWVKDDDKLEITVIHTFSKILELYAVVNGRTYKIVNNKFTILYFADELSINIKVILNGKILKHIPCETLKIINLDSEKVVVPELDNLKLQIEEQNKRLTEELEKIKLENEQLKAENEKLKEFIQNEIGDEEDE